LPKENEDSFEVKPENEENQKKLDTRGFDDKEQIFDESMEPKKLKENKKLKYFLKIKGYINPVNFSKDDLIYEYIKLNGSQCFTKVNLKVMKQYFHIYGINNLSSTDNLPG